jgi:hypothetical protein
MLKIKSIIFLSIIFLLIACKKESAVFKTEKIKDYYLLKVGKYINYKLDSTVYLNLGTKKEVRSYLVQDKIDSIITDNLGRPSYKIKRTIRSNTDTTKWKDLMSYLVTFDSTRLELVQDNQRYLKMVEPISNGFNWKGNSYINTAGIPSIQYLEDWRYTYENVRRPFTVNGISYTETVTVNQRNDTSGNAADKKFYFEINYSKEVYSKSIGLIFKEFLHEAWQPPNASSPGGYYESNSYGIRLTIIGHNF